MAHYSDAIARMAGAPSPSDDQVVRISFGARRLPETVPVTLSPNATKRWFFAQDIFFREAWWALSDGLGDGPAELDRLAMILFKPDAVVSRSIQRCIETVAGIGLVAVHDAGIKLDRLTIRELWRYDLNIASRSRMPLIDDLLTASPSHLVIFAADQVSIVGSASEWLARAKGPSRPTVTNRRLPEHIRSRIGSGVGVLNYIHSPDDTADLVREIGVLLDPAGTDALIAAIIRREPQPAAKIAERAYQGTQAEDLRLEPLLARLVAQHAGALPARAGKALAALAAGNRPRAEEWLELHQHLTVVGALSRWERIVLVAHAVETDMEGAVPLLDQTNWRLGRD